MEEGKYASIKELIEYGLDKVDNKKTTVVRVRDLIYIYKTIEDLRRFFHQREHYPTLEDVHKYMGTNKDEGMNTILNHIYLRVFEDIFDKDITEEIENDVFHSPKKPYYYKLKE